MAEVRLVDLVVIKRYSLAVRREWAPAEEVLAALDASREAVLAVVRGEPAGGPPAPDPGRDPVPETAPEPGAPAEAGSPPAARARSRRRRTAPPGPPA